MTLAAIRDAMGLNMSTDESPTRHKSVNRPINGLVATDKMAMTREVDIQMPDSAELERRFQKGMTTLFASRHYLMSHNHSAICQTPALASMDLPPDKAKLLRGYDIEKKWEMIRDQEKVTAKESPEFYLRRLSTYLDPKASRNTKKVRLLGGCTSTQVLRDLEISLRTNSIEWVRDFLSEDHNGLDMLIEYLTFRLATQQQQHQLREHQNGSEDHLNNSPDIQTGTSLLRFEFSVFLSVVSTLLVRIS